MTSKMIVKTEKLEGSLSISEFWIMHLGTRHSPITSHS